jgi:5'-nucleotidase
MSQARTVLLAAAALSAAALAGCAVAPPIAPPLAPPVAPTGAALADHGGAAPDLTTQVRLRVIGFNDLHGNLRSPGRYAASRASAPLPAGGVDSLAAYVKNLRADAPHSIVVAAGDLIGASPLDSALFHDEATIEVLNRIGLDVSAVGNHEFDAGKDELLRKQRGGCAPGGIHTCEGRAVGTPVPFEGAHFQYLAANVVDEARGQTLLPAYAIRSFEGVKVGFIGVTLAGTPGVVTPSGVAGLRFADEADTVNALIPKLHAQGVQTIVVLIHQGGVQATAGINALPDINGCADQLQDDVISPIRAIVRRFDAGVDLVISGHTHMAYICMLPERGGRMVPVTQAASYGRVITAVDLTLDKASGKLVSAKASNRVVDRANPAVLPDTAIAEFVGGYDTLAAPLETQIVGKIAAAVSNTANAAGEMPAGDLIADAQLAATAPAALGGAMAAFMNPGGIRGSGFIADAYPHAVSYGEAFNVQPFGNSLVVMDLTAGQIKDLLEQQFAGCKGQTSTRILQVSRGFEVRWSAGAPACRHISDVRLTHDGIVDTLASGGIVASPEKTVRVTVNSYLASGGDHFTVLAGGANRLGGAQDIDALVAYLARFKEPMPGYDPSAAGSGARITRAP